jgi:SAM-dependent methyltransferase
MRYRLSLSYLILGALMEQSQTGVFEQSATVKLWDEDYYHPIAERYYDASIPAMLHLIGANPGSTVLDAGCGPGVHTIRAARAGCEVVAIDISQTMLDEARQRTTAAGFSGKVKFEQQDLTKLTFRDGSYKHIFSWGVIIHIKEVERALDELTRVLQQGGRLALYVTNERALDRMIERTARKLLRRPALGDQRFPLGSGRWYDMHGHKLWVWQFDINALVRAAESRGLQLVSREVGEFSEIQRYARGPIRRILLRMNNLIYRCGIGRSMAVANLLIFEKPIH